MDTVRAFKVLEEHEENVKEMEDLYIRRWTPQQRATPPRNVDIKIRNMVALIIKQQLNDAFRLSSINITEDKKNVVIDCTPDVNHILLITLTKKNIRLTVADYKLSTPTISDINYPTDVSDGQRIADMVFSTFKNTIKYSLDRFTSLDNKNSYLFK